MRDSRYLPFFLVEARHSLHVHSRSLISLKSGSTHVAEFVTSQLACDAHTRLRVFDFYRIQALNFDKQRALLLLQFVDRVLVELRDTSCVRCLVTIHRPPMLDDAGMVALQQFIFALPLFRPHAERFAGRKQTASISTLAAKKNKNTKRFIKKRKQRQYKNSSTTKNMCALRRRCR